MANHELSHNFVINLLKDNIQVSPITTEKIEYFRKHIKEAYPAYKKTFADKARSFQLFATNIIKRHSHTILNQRIEFQKTYFKNPSYIEKLIKDTVKAEEAKLNPDHTFTRDEYIDPTILTFENLVDRRYKKFLVVDQTSFDLKKRVLYTITKRFFDELISGLTLLEREFYNDAFIIWRSLLETTSSLLILFNHPELTGKYVERKGMALIRHKLHNTTREIQDSKTKEAKTSLGDKGVSWYHAERYAWVGPLLNGNDYSIKSLLEIAKLDTFNSHYTFASLFVHEYSIDGQDLKMEIDFEKYLLTLYFELYEKVRIIISDNFTNDLDDAKKLEKGVRDEVLNFKTRFKDFSLRIAMI